LFFNHLASLSVDLFFEVSRNHLIRDHSGGLF
jgi:hypothetical protein